MRSKPLISRIAFFLVMIAPISIVAQTPTESVCFSPKPLAECERFVFFDAGVAGGLFTAPHEIRPPSVNGITFASQHVEDLKTYGFGALGFMSNRDNSHAVGGSFEFRYDGEHPSVALKAHHRTWFPNNRSIDLSAGPLATEVWQLTNDTNAPCTGCLVRAWSYGGTADVAVAERHGLGLVAGVDLIRGNGRTSAGLHAGVRMESYSAVAATLLAGILGVAAYYLTAGTDY